MSEHKPDGPGPGVEGEFIDELKRRRDKNREEKPPEKPDPETPPPGGTPVKRIIRKPGYKQREPKPNLVV